MNGMENLFESMLTNEAAPGNHHAGRTSVWGWGGAPQGVWGWGGAPQGVWGWGGAPQGVWGWGGFAD